MTKKRVLLRGPVLTQSGYGVHSRQIARWLFSKESDLDITTQPLRWGGTAWNLHPELHDGLVGKVLETAKAPQPPYDVTLQIQLPNEWDEKLGKFNVDMAC